jgi:hypothetical protein
VIDARKRLVPAPWPVRETCSRERLLGEVVEVRSLL